MQTTITTDRKDSIATRDGKGKRACLNEKLKMKSKNKKFNF